MDNKDMIERVIDYLDDCRRRNDAVRIMFDCVDANLVLDLNDRYLLRELITMIAHNADSFVVPRGDIFQSPDYYDKMVKEMMDGEPEDIDEEPPHTKPQVEPKVPEGEVRYIIPQKPTPLDNGYYLIVTEEELPDGTVNKMRCEVPIDSEDARESFYTMMRVRAEQLTRTHGIAYQFCDPDGEIEIFFDRLESFTKPSKNEDD